MNRAAEKINLTRAREKRLYGEGVTVAVLDTGITQHPDLYDRIKVFKDFVNRKQEMYDDFGHGTHVTGILAGSGVVDERYRGVAPQVNIVSLKVLDRYGNGKRETVTEALKWILQNYQRYEIRIVNISVGTVRKDDKLDQELMDAVEKLWDMGLTVICAAGNLGPRPYTITAPGSSRKVITVGALQEYQMKYSGCGPTMECICKPDIVAPGSFITSCRSDFGPLNGYYCMKSGTSMATPMVTGAAALLMQKEPGITNVEIKMRLKDSARDLGRPHSVQGWGLLDVKELLNI